MNKKTTSIHQSTYFWQEKFKIMILFLCLKNSADSSPEIPNLHRLSKCSMALTKTDTIASLGAPGGAKHLRMAYTMISIMAISEQMPLYWKIAMIKLIQFIHIIDLSISKTKLTSFSIFQSSSDATWTGWWGTDEERRRSCLWRDNVRGLSSSTLMSALLSTKSSEGFSACFRTAPEEAAGPWEFSWNSIN